MRDPSSSADGRVTTDEQSVELAVGDGREALRRQAAQGLLQAHRVVTKARELTEQSRQVGPDLAERADPPLAAAPEECGLRRAAGLAGKTILCVGLSALVGLLANWMEHPPTVVTLIIVATCFGALVASELPQRRP